MRVNRWSFVFICLNQALWPDAQAQHRFGKGSPKRKKGSDHSLVHFDARGNEPSYGRTPFLDTTVTPPEPEAAFLRAHSAIWRRRSMCPSATAGRSTSNSWSFPFAGDASA